ncbi:Predicted permease family protein [Desulfamplus magnetovallimortis]|uniref:Predicted permease family protein n=1 Tax=Desulfamplus magnetovallimortis TaxID=1246637 RepID=L0R4J1_9BACT|nr:LPS export ABC transporter permease LptF [Desulfamplus magnetovallimortis]CCO06784.1 Predicted permease family protein [Desulfamplus magnetovallimortis BW-1]SLM32835.1 Predicted permease family protein [Desulfamplus magnetovallimortis]
MKISTILNRYIFRELLSPFFTSLIFLTFVFLMTRIPDITNMVVNYHAGIPAVFLLILYSLPRFMEFTIPMSVMISVLLTMMRMASDNEIIAVKGAGISLYRLVPPVMLFSVLGTILTLWIALWGVPWGKFSFTTKGAELARSTVQFALKERQFNTMFDGIMIYVTSVNVKNYQMSDIFIQESQNSDNHNITIASEGMLISNEQKNIYTLHLVDGIVNQVNIKNGSVNTMSFETYDINFDMNARLRDIQYQKKDYNEMYPDELFEFIRKGEGGKKELLSARMELHEKFSIPFACIALGFLSIPVGVSSASSRRSSGFGMGLSLFLFYYLLLAAGWSACETGYSPPFIGMWISDLVILVIAIFLFSRVAAEKTLPFPFESG